MEQIDESMLSALKFKLAHYLDASTVSARNAALEKEHIPMLLSNISHQTIAPIANLRLYGKLLQAQSLDEESRDYVNALNVQTQKLDFLVSSLVKMSRLETGIAEEEQAQVFSRFYRSQLLATPGKGSVFAVNLPVKTPNLSKP